MKVHVFLQIGQFKLVDEEVESDNTSEALRQAMARPGVACHLPDLCSKPISAEVTVIPEVKAA